MNSPNLKFIRWTKTNVIKFGCFDIWRASRTLGALRPFPRILSFSAISIPPETEDTELLTLWEQEGYEQKKIGIGDEEVMLYWETENADSVKIECLGAVQGDDLATNGYLRLSFASIGGFIDGCEITFTAESHGRAVRAIILLEVEEPEEIEEPEEETDPETEEPEEEIRKKTRKSKNRKKKSREKEVETEESDEIEDVEENSEK